MIRACLKAGAIVVLGATLTGLACPSPSAHAQDAPRPGGPDRRGVDQPGRGCGPGDRRPRDEDRRGRREGLWDLRALFLPSPEDHGPLRPGELEELRAFVEESLPNLHVLLKRLETRGAPSVRKHFHRLVPRLRQLRRIHHQNPEMAQLLARHAENLFSLEGLRRSWVQATAEERGPLEQQARGYVAANLRIQIAALELWADQLERTRAERVAERLSLVTGPDADLAVEAPPVRRLVEAIHQLEDETQQRALTEELAALLATQLDDQIAALRTRAVDMKDSLSEEVDRRLEWFRSGRPPRPPRP